MAKSTTKPRERTTVLGGGLSRGLVLLLATTCGAAVANLYYGQPLLHTLAQDFDVSDATAGLLITIGQIGYGLGLAFLVPLGDLHERRRLITFTMAISATGMVLGAIAPSFAVFGSALFVVGVTSVVAMVIVPMSSSMAVPSERGRVVGTVMSGLLIGILLARTISGLIASAFGWRVVYWLGALVMVTLATTLHRRLPRVPPTTELTYRQLLRSVVVLVREQPILRQRMMIGAMTFGCFNVLWTSLAFLLSGPPYNYGNAVIGLFGLVGLAGAAAATVTGRLTDRGLVRHVTMATILLLLVSWPLLAAGKTSVIALIVGIAVLDLGVQGLHIANQSAIYALSPDARSRLTTAYMVAYFIGGGVLSALTATVYATEGWDGVCVLGAATAVVALAVWVVTETWEKVRDRREVQVG